MINLLDNGKAEEEAKKKKKREREMLFVVIKENCSINANLNK